MREVLELLDSAVKQGRVDHLIMENGQLIMGLAGAAREFLAFFRIGSYSQGDVRAYLEQHEGELISAAKEWLKEGRGVWPIQKAINELYESFPTQHRPDLIGAVYSEWMGLLSDTAKEGPLSDIIVPGTHYSSAFHVYPQAYMSQDRDDPGNWIIANTPLKELVAGWLLTQSYSIMAQLEHGVRMLNFEIAYDPIDREIYCVHTFINGLLSTMLADVHAFVAAHPTEVVYVNIELDPTHLDPTLSNLDKVTSILEYTSKAGYWYTGIYKSDKLSLKCLAEAGYNTLLLGGNEAHRIADYQIMVNVANPRHAFPVEYSRSFDVLFNAKGHLTFAIEPTPATGIVYGIGGFNLTEPTRELNAKLPQFMGKYAKGKQELISIDMAHPDWAEIEAIILSNWSLVGGTKVVCEYEHNGVGEPDEGHFEDFLLKGVYRRELQQEYDNQDDAHIPYYEGLGDQGWGGIF